jgi:hypothetical protein
MCPQRRAHLVPDRIEKQIHRPSSCEHLNAQVLVIEELASHCSDQISLSVGGSSP